MPITEGAIRAKQPYATAAAGGGGGLRAVSARQRRSSGTVDVLSASSRARMGASKTTLLNSEEAKTLKELSDAYSHAEQLTQELLAQAQQLLRSPGPSAPLASASHSPSSPTENGKALHAASRAGSARTKNTGGGKKKSAGTIEAHAASSSLALTASPQSSPEQQPRGIAALKSEGGSLISLGSRSSGTAGSRPPSASSQNALNIPPSASPLATVSRPPSASPLATVSRPPSASPLATVSRPPSASPLATISRPPSASPLATVSRPPSASPLATVSRPPSAVTGSMARQPDISTPSTAPESSSRPSSAANDSAAVITQPAAVGILTTDEAALLSEALGEPASPVAAALDNALMQDS